MSTSAISILRRSVYCLLLSLFLNGCDGGIFGTGDGDPPVLIIDGSAAEDTNSEPAAAPPEPDSNSDDASDEPEAQSPSTNIKEPQFENSVDGFNPENDVSATSGTTIEFVNPYVVNNETTAGLRLINLTTANVGVFSSDAPDSPVIVETLPNQVSATGSIPNGSSALFIDALDNNRARMNLSSMDPETLSAGSETLLVLRRLEPTVDVIALPEITNTNDLPENFASVRFVSAALIGDPEVPSNFTIEPDPNFPAVDIPISLTFGPISYDSPVSPFISLQAGRYLLSDDVGRYSNIPLDLSLAGSITTLILDPSIENSGFVLTVEQP